ncbi:hypothetical protein RZS08_63430, partial [Arthrospira platensis SPKY1]|nr:hypothetical protein [Arthrospira platensis SPKY1]
MPHQGQITFVQISPRASGHPHQQLPHRNGKRQQEYQATIARCQPAPRTLQRHPAVLGPAPADLIIT